MALVTRDARGLIATIDIYGRPWSWVGVIRDRIVMLASLPRRSRPWHLSLRS